MKSKRIIVTGCSRGIGLELVKNLAKNGHSVLAVSRKPPRNEDFGAYSKKVYGLKAEITQADGCNAIANFVENEWGGVDILIHNAGTLVNMPFEKTTSDLFQEVYKVNVFALAELTRVLVPFMGPGSHVVAISSMGGIQGSMKFAGLSAYSSSKGAVITLMELLAEEYKEKSISFNALAIGAVQTEMLKEAFPEYQAQISATEMAAYIADFSLKGNKLFNGKVIQVSNTTP